MDPLSSIVLTILGISVLAYSVYGAVRKGVRDGLNDHYRDHAAVHSENRKLSG